MILCMVCNHVLEPEEWGKYEKEATLFPAHQECLDEYNSLDEFIEESIKLISKRLSRDLIE